MSPRNPPSATIQKPSTPTLFHTFASPVHPSTRPPISALSHSSNSLGLTPPSPTPSTSSISGANRLDVGSRIFVPRAAKLTIKKADGTEVSLENLTKSTPTPPTSAVPSAAAKAKAEAISKPEPEKKEEAELEAHKGDGKEDGQLEDGKDVDT
jgi:translation initiation factor 4G